MRTLSTGHPSTLGSYRSLVAIFFGEESPALAFLDWKIKSAPNGADEEVIADEEQMLLLLARVDDKDVAPWE